MDARLVIRYVVRETMGLVGMGAALFWSAGQWDWWQAWAALGVMGAWVGATAVIVLHFTPDLLAERLGPHQGSKRWDIAILSLLGLVQLIRYIVAGLDQRYGWTHGLPLAAQIAALLLSVIGYALVVWATAVNNFFSQTVRIQPERGHTVVTSGPYGYVRHPAYLGAILYEITIPILLTSWWAFIPSGISSLLLLLRTTFEDRTLQSELAGYTDYARQVPYRLLPGVW